MKYKLSPQPMFARKKWDYNECAIEGYKDCYCYEMKPEDTLIYVPDGGKDFLWNRNRKILCTLDCGSRVTKVEQPGDTLLGLHISPLYNAACSEEQLRLAMEKLGGMDSFREQTRYWNRKFSEIFYIEEVHPLIRHTLTRIMESKGQAAVEELAEAADYTPRQLEYVFRDHFGCGPKRLSQYIRLHCAVSYIVREPEKSFGVWAGQLGYSDQSHFQREFKRFLGMTPKQFVMRYL